MGDQQSGDSIRQMLSGFNAMQHQLGLLPMQTQQQPLGVGFQPSPPPPLVPHPSDAALQAVQQQQLQIQQTMQAAQMTRYVPPPSTPMAGGGMAFGWGGTMNQLSANQLPPFLASALGGGGGGLTMPNPMSMTAPQYGAYRPAGPMAFPQLGSGRVPHFMNPFAPQLPPAQFMTPAMQSLQILQGYQSQHAAMLGAVTQGAFALGGTVLGSTLGSAFGPLGTMAGGWIGGKVGGAFTDIMPGMTDIQRGRQLQSASAPWMVSGAVLNPFTGQGMERGAARATATGLRHLWRDQEFDKTGFNTADVLRITQLASDQGLLATARSPDEITRKVKDISKALKNIIAITGDPDVQGALQQLGQLRQLGFAGLGSQMGAVANRAAFARMAGVSQGAMDQMYGTPGAMMGQQVGLAGATGYNAGMGGGGFANLAASSGALNDLQLARAGGKQGLAQTNAMAALGAANQDTYMAAALRRGPGGDLNVDIDAYRAAQRMDIGQVARAAAHNLHDVGPQGVFELSTRRQEFKDRLAQQLGPTEMQLNVLRQAKAMQRTVGHGMTLGAAFRTMVHSTGQYGSPEEEEQAARSLELQYESPEFYDGMVQQLKAQRRDAADRERARRDPYRTPGVWSRTKRSVRGFFADLSDDASRPFVNLAERMDRVSEDRALANRGEYAMRWNPSQLIQSPRDRALALQALESRGFQQAFSQLGNDPFASAGFNLNGMASGAASGHQFGGMGGAMGAGLGLASDLVGSRNQNRIGAMLGLANYSDANRIVDVASRSYGTSFGWHPFSSFGDVGKARARVTSVLGAAAATQDALRMTDTKAVAIKEHLNRQAELGGIAGFSASGLVTEAGMQLRKNLPKAYAEVSAGAASEEDFKKSWIEANVAKGIAREDALRMYHAPGNKEKIHALMAEQVYMSGDKKGIESLQASSGIAGLSNAVTGQRPRDVLEKDIQEGYRRVGLSGFGKATTERAKGLLKEHDARALAYAAALAADPGDTHAAGTMHRLRAAYAKDEKGFRALEKQAMAINAGASDDVRAVLKHMLHAGGAGTRGEDNFAEAQSFLGQDMGNQAQKTVLAKLEQDTGKKGLVNKTPLEAMRSLQKDEIDRIKDPGLKAAARALYAGKVGAEKELNAAVVDASATAQQEIFGGETGPETDRYDALITEADQFRKDSAKKNGGGDKAAQIWVTTAEILAGAAKDLKSAAENMVLHNGYPSVQGDR